MTKPPLNPLAGTKHPGETGVFPAGVLLVSVTVVVVVVLGLLLRRNFQDEEKVGGY
jgi:hypothetical protein